MKIFISHSSRDGPLANAVVQYLTVALALRDGDVRCTSVPGYRLPKGSRVAETLRRDLSKSGALLALLTPNSLESTWVLFELGAAWGLQRAIIPIVTDRLTLADLPPSLQDPTPVRWDEDTDWFELVDSLAHRLRVKKTRAVEATAQLPSRKAFPGLAYGDVRVWQSRLEGNKPLRSYVRSHGQRILIHDTFWAKRDNEWHRIVEDALARDASVSVVFLAAGSREYRARLSMVLGVRAVSKHIDESWLRTMRESHSRKFKYGFVSRPFTGPFVCIDAEHLFLGLFAPETPSDSMPLLYLNTGSGAGAEVWRAITAWLPRGLNPWNSTG
jgi:hypothetical protein